MNSYWLIDANLKLWVDDDNHQRFHGAFQDWKISRTLPTYNVMGDFQSDRVATTSAESSSIAQGIVYHSKGWTQTRIEKSMKFESRVANFNNGTMMTVDQLVTSRTETQIQRGVNGSDIVDTEVEIVDRTLPLKLYTHYTEYDSKFNLDVSITHAQNSITQNSNGQSSVTNEQRAVGNFGTLKKTYNILDHKLEMKSNDECYLRKVSTIDAVVKADTETNCRLLITR